MHLWKNIPESWSHLCFGLLPQSAYGAQPWWNKVPVMSYCFNIWQNIPPLQRTCKGFFLVIAKGVGLKALWNPVLFIKPGCECLLAGDTPSQSCFPQHPKSGSNGSTASEGQAWSLIPSFVQYLARLCLWRQQTQMPIRTRARIWNGKQDWKHWLASPEAF